MALGLGKLTACPPSLMADFAGKAGHCPSAIQGDGKAGLIDTWCIL